MIELLRELSTSLINAVDEGNTADVVSLPARIIREIDYLISMFLAEAKKEQDKKYIEMCRQKMNLLDTIKNNVSRGKYQAAIKLINQL